MIRAIVLLSLSLEINAQSATGLPTCKCLNPLPSDVKRVACTYKHGVNGLCFQTTGLASNFTLYPGDYGESCKIHQEVGHSACYDLTTVPPRQKATSQQKDWCEKKWCYVDPCNCDASDATKSDYFPGTLFYSYGTCGDKNTYTATESATNTVGNAECTTASSESADAESVKMSVVALLAGVGALM